MEKDGYLSDESRSTLRASIIIIRMNRNSKENIKTNTVFVIGEIERVKLNSTEKLKRVSLAQNSQFKNIKPDTVNNPMKVFTQGNAMVVIDGKNTLIQIMRRVGW